MTAGGGRCPSADSPSALLAKQLALGSRETVWHHLETKANVRSAVIYLLGASDDDIAPLLSTPDEFVAEMRQVMEA
jgi:hypothetical protein